MIKQPIIKSRDVIPYKFRPLVYGISVKDSFSIEHDEREYMMCTNMDDGGLVVLGRVGESFVPVQTLFPGWTDMWAPCLVRDGDEYIVFCSDTEGKRPFWKMQRIKFFRWYPGMGVDTPQIYTVPFSVGPKSRIDPEIMQIGDTFYLFYVVMDLNNGEWWDVYYSTSKSLTGPYEGEYNISQMVEHGIEEAPRVIGNQLYWSIENCDINSTLRRGDMEMNNGTLNVIEDENFKMAAISSPVCTHPDEFKGKIRATLKNAAGRFYIGECYGLSNT